MKFKQKTLNNGLVIIGEVNKYAQSAAVGFFVKTGACDETAEINGVSHFLEHMMFKGTDKLSALEVNQAFDKTGAQFNAFTSEENTVYYAAVLPEYVLEITSLWSQLMRPSLRDDDFNIEKNVIKEEIAMYKDLPQFDVLDRGRHLHFGSHPCSNSVLGTNESITDLTCEQMKEYFARRYAPNNLVLACSGNFNWDDFSRLTEDMCGNWKSSDVNRKTEFFAGTKKADRKQKSNLAREHICLIGPAVSAQDERRFAARLLAKIIGDETGSRYFWELVDKAIAELAVMQLECMDGVGAMYSYLRCDTKNASIVLDTVKNIFDCLTQDGITEDELTKAKNKVLSELTLKNELPMGRLIDLGFNWTYLQQYRIIKSDIDAIKAVTVDDINSIIEEFNPSDFTQFSIGPA